MEGKSIARFCPTCSTYLKYTFKDDDLKLICNNCLYEENASSGINILRVKEEQLTHNLFNPEMIYDKTVMTTKKLNCTNSECPTQNPDNWEKFNPELKMMSFFDVNRNMSVFCEHCKKVYQLVSK